MNFEEEPHPFIIEKELGEGAVGTVELARDPATAKCYAMKTVPRPVNPIAHMKAMKALSKEIAVMRQVKHHHCVELCASWTDFESVVLLSSPVADMDLAKFMRLDMSSDRNTFLRQSIGCLCKAIKYLHNHKIR